ncbi:MAG: DHH family phosphoesterase [Candidatus Micrarchaeota archaeon]
MQVQRNESKFFKSALAAGKRILEEFNDAVIVHHFDADGLPAGAIVFSAMYRNGIAPAMLCWKKMTVENVEQLAAKRREKQIIFCDLGAGYTSVFEEHLKDKEIIILDHHREEKLDVAKNITLVTPHQHGIDGDMEVAAGGVCYLAFRNYVDLSQLALVSAVGDMQDKIGMQGVNKIILSDAVKAGIATVKKDLMLFGKGSRSLTNFLCYSSDPFLPGLTGNAKNCALFLHENNIPYKQGNKYVSYYDLDLDNQKKLASALIEYCVEKLPSESTANLIGDVFVFPKEEKGPFYEAHEFATILNACGRNNAAETGVKACLKDSEARNKTIALYEEHRLNLRRGITLSRGKISDVGEFYLLDCRGQIKDNIIGTVAGALSGSPEIVHGKPVIALANDDEDKQMAKVSARCTAALVAQGIDLGELLGTATADLGKSFGGGHKIAAGASVEKKHLPEFLKRCAEIIKSAQSNSFVSESQSARLCSRQNKANKEKAEEK